LDEVQKSCLMQLLRPHHRPKTAIANATNTQDRRARLADAGRAGDHRQVRPEAGADHARRGVLQHRAARHLPAVCWHGGAGWWHLPGAVPGVGRRLGFAVPQGAAELCAAGFTARPRWRCDLGLAWFALDGMPGNRGARADSCTPFAITQTPDRSRRWSTTPTWCAWPRTTRCWTGCWPCFMWSAPS